MTIRDACAADVEAINHLYNHYQRNSFALWRWRERTSGEAMEWLGAHTGRYCALVAVQGDKLLGFASLSPFRPSEGYWPTAENSIYVQPDCTGQGVGRALMASLAARARAGGLRHIVAVIDSENQPSIDFHAGLGFVLRGTLPNIGEKWNKERSATFMQLTL